MASDAGLDGQLVNYFRQLSMRRLTGSHVLMVGARTRYLIKLHATMLQAAAGAAARGGQSCCKGLAAEGVATKRCWTCRRGCLCCFKLGLFFVSVVLPSGSSDIIPVLLDVMHQVNSSACYQVFNVFKF
jgi:hypothetical protein